MSKIIALRPKRLRTQRSKLPIAPRLPNAAVRSREHLTPPEVERVIRAAGKIGRYPKRDAALIAMMFRHGLRVSELIALLRADIDLDSRAKTVHVNRVKSGSPATHPVSGQMARALRAVMAASPDSRYMFVTERGGPLSSSAVRRIVARAGEVAKLAFKIHPHMIRHSTGYFLANKGVDTRTIQAYLGHKNIQHTVRYTALAPDRFNGLFD